MSTLVWDYLLTSKEFNWLQGIRLALYIYIYDGLSKCLFPVLLINRNSMRAASCLPFKNMTYLDDVKTWKFFVTFGNLAKTTGIG